MKYTRWLNQSVLRTLRITMVFVFIVSLITCAAIYALSANTLREEIVLSGQERLRQTRIDGDNLYNQSYLLLRQLVLDEDVKQYNYDPDVDQLSKRYPTRQLREKILSVLLYSNVIKKAYIWYEASDVVVGSNSALCGLDELHSTEFAGYIADPEQFRGFINGIDRLTTFTIESGDMPYVVIVSPNSSNNYTTSKAYILLLLDARSLLGSAQRVGASSTGVYLISNGNVAIAHSGVPLPENLDLGFSMADSGQYEDADNIYLFEQSIIPGYRYMVAFSKQEFYRQVNRIGWLCWVLVGIYFVLALLSMSGFDRWHSIQLKALLSSVARKTGVAMPHAQNELNYIDDALNATLNERELMRGKLEVQRDIARAGCLSGLLAGKLHSDIASLNSQFDFQFKPGVFLVIIYGTDDAPGDQYALESSADANVNIRDYALTSITDEILRSQFAPTAAQAMGITMNALESTRFNGELVAVLNFAVSGSVPPELDACLNEGLRTVLRRIENMLNIKATLAAGNPHADIAGIHAGYTEAMCALEQRYFVQGQVLAFAMLPEALDGGQLIYPMAVEQKLINLLVSGNAADARELVHNVLSTNDIPQCQRRVGEARRLFAELIATLIKAYNEICRTAPETGKPFLLETAALSKLDTLAQTCDALDDAVESLCAHTVAQGNSHDTLAGQVNDYIIEHYMDQELTAVALSEKFGFTSYYLSRLYKEATGITVTDQLTNIRMERAADELSRSKLPIQEISAHCGYREYGSFSRAFKQRYGVSPQKYRNIGDAPAAPR